MSYSQYGLNSQTAKQIIETLHALPGVTEALVTYGFTMEMLENEHSSKRNSRYSEPSFIEMFEEHLEGYDYVEWERLQILYYQGRDLVHEIIVSRFSRQVDEFCGFAE
jgi:hypothetical protein